MNTQTIGFVGAGRITAIALSAWARAARAPSVVVSDPDLGVRDRLAATGVPVTTTTDNQQAASQGIVFLALHPPQFGAVLAEIASSLRPDAIVVSFAPKWTTARISQALGGFARLARVIPNAPSVVGAGYNPVSFAEGLPESARRELLSLLEPWGQAPVVAESTLEAYAILSAMGPTYLWPQLFRLITLGQEFGLSDDAARAAIVAMVHGTATTLERSALGHDEVMDLIPVKPLAGHQAAWQEAYSTTLRELFAKLKA